MIQTLWHLTEEQIDHWQSQQEKYSMTVDGKKYRRFCSAETGKPLFMCKIEGYVTHCSMNNGRHPK